MAMLCHALLISNPTSCLLPDCLEDRRVKGRAPPPPCGNTKVEGGKSMCDWWRVALPKYRVRRTLEDSFALGLLRDYERTFQIWQAHYDEAKNIGHWIMMIMVSSIEGDQVDLASHQRRLTVPDLLSGKQFDCRSQT